MVGLLPAVCLVGRLCCSVFTDVGLLWCGCCGALACLCFLWRGCCGVFAVVSLLLCVRSERVPVVFTVLSLVWCISCGELTEVGLLRCAASGVFAVVGLLWRLCCVFFAVFADFFSVLAVVCLL